MKKLTLLLALWINLLTVPAFAFEAFVVKNIQIQGLSRISAATVESYLPIHRGESLNPDQTANIIKGLYQTGFFDDIALSQRANTLIIIVVERPIIGQLKIAGNSFISTDKLTTLMKGLNIAEGRVYNRGVLDKIKQSLLNQYYQLGRYNAKVDVRVIPDNRGRVLIKIDISEGLVAKIRHINFIGNKAFTAKKLNSELTLTTAGIATFITQTDRYSEEKLEESLQNLRNFYLDKGYVGFAIKSSQVLLTPDRKSVYINIVMEEGVPYKVKGYQPSGEFPVAKEELTKFVTLSTGSVFSRKAVMDAQKAMSDYLGSKGYIFATISLAPEVDEATKQIFLNFHVAPGKRTYVRHIYFTDNTKTNDEVLRREIQQMEAALVSTTQLEESKHRLALLPYIRDVQMTVRPVALHDDQVDVGYKVTEQNAAELTGGIGYSQLEHVLLSAGVSQKNFLGTGKTVGFNFQKGRFGQNYGINYTDPYYTPDGISRTINVAASSYDPGALNLTNSYTTNEYDFTDVFSIPIGQERGAINRIQLGYGYQNTLLNFANLNQVSKEVQAFANRYGRRFQQFNLIAGVTRDNRDQAIFPTRGAMQSLGLNLYLPLDGKLRYYTINYSNKWYHPIVSDFILTARGLLAYGNNFQSARDYPFFKNFYAGGFDSVRGYTDNTLGPKDSNDHAAGGNFLVDGSLGFILPKFISDNERTTLFIDAGNVYRSYNNRVYQGTASGAIRMSMGVGVDWLTAMGPISVSLARAINPAHGDQLTMFQFAIGANFG